MGRHSFAVLLTNGATVGKIRLQRHKTTPEDYVATLERVGFRVGSKGPISRDKSREAMEWLRDKWKQKLAADPSCSVLATVGLMTGMIAGEAAGASSITTSVVPPSVTPPTTPQVGPPVGPPVLPPPTGGDTQPPATPVLPVR